MAAQFNDLVSAFQLSEQIGSEKLVVLDASWHLPGEGRDPGDEYLQHHIPGARFFDLEAISDAESPYPHMMPGEDQFAAAIGRLGIGHDHHVVVYDSGGVFAAARAWMMLRAFGHTQVSILDGGLGAWIEAGLDFATGPEKTYPQSFEPSFDKTKIAHIDDVRAALGDPLIQILDARGPGRFSGVEKEPRAGLRSGHMPGALNIYYGDLFDKKGCFKSLMDIEAVMKDRGVDLSLDTITTCGSGVTASILSFCLFRLGKPWARVYDGSWVEWGSRNDTPLVRDAANTLEGE
jgi:thiosulfate/3-mercaptopyruvate sulfurtransferase